MRTLVPLPVSTEEWPLMTFTPTGPLSIHRDAAGEIYVASSVSGKRDDTGNEWKLCLGKASVSPPKVLLIITLGPRRLWVSPVLLSHAHRVRQRLVCGGEEHACKKIKNIDSYPHNPSALCVFFLDMLLVSSHHSLYLCRVGESPKCLCACVHV